MTPITKASVEAMLARADDAGRLARAYMEAMTVLEHHGFGCKSTGCAPEDNCERCYLLSAYHGGNGGQEC